MSSTITDMALTLDGSPELSLLAKITVLLLLGLSAAWVARGSTAALRHFILASTLIAALSLPLLVMVTPEIPFRLPLAAASYEASLPTVTPLSIAKERPTMGIPGPQPDTQSNAWGLPSVPTLFLCVWLAGAAVFLVRLGLQLWQLRCLRRTGLPVLALQFRLKQLAIQCGVRRSVEYLTHESIASPLTCGFRRPAILLPSDLNSWPEADQYRALVHELEHLRRGDWMIQILARLTGALYWFHPLVWISLRRLCLEAERACDDAVVLATSGTEYAEQLVSLASRMSGVRVQGAIGMAHRSDLSSRVAAILDFHQRRGRVDVFTSVLVLAGVATAVVMLAPLRAVAQSSAGQDRQPSLASALTERPKPLDRALFEAAERGELSDMQRLIRDGANVNARLFGDGSALIAAARGGHNEAVRLLLENGANPNMGVHGDGSPLIMAAQNRHLSTVRLLLDGGADIHMPVIGDGNPLIMAARGGSEEVVQFLLDRGANIEQIVKGDENALIEASASGHLPIVKLLLSRGANVNSRVWIEPQGDRPGEWRTPLNRAHLRGHKDVEAYLRSVGAKE